MKTKEAIANRRSCKAFRKEQITDRELNIILQGANAAPMGMGRYESVKLTVIQNEELLTHIDRKGAVFFGDASLHPLYGAPTMVVISGENKDVELAMCNASCIAENMLITASDLGLGACYIRGCLKAVREDEEICRLMKVPEGFLPCAGVILGYPKETPKAGELVTDKLATDFVR